MRKSASRLAGVMLGLLVAVSCGRQEGKARERSFLEVAEPVKVSELVCPALVRTSQGTLIMTAFIHSSFPTATEVHEAIAVFESTDDGVTWRHAASIPSSVTYGVWGYDLALGEDDGLYLTWVATLYDAERRRPHKAIMFSRSTDGGRSWEEPVAISDSREGQRHRPVLAVSGEDVYVAWLDGRRRSAGTPAQRMEQDVYLAASRDRGATWAANACLEADLDRKDSPSGRPAICARADGAVYCAYFSIRRYRKKEGGYWLATSRDRGATFSTALQNVGPLADMDVVEAGGKVYLAAVYIKGIKRISMRRPETYQEVHLYVSPDGGATWDGPIRIDDDPERRRKSNLRLAHLGADALVACWDDDRGGVYMAASNDGGKTWGKNVKVAQESHAGSTPLDIATAGTSFYVVVSDVRKGPDDATFLVRGRVHP